MSALVFPILPLVQPEKAAQPSYSTWVGEAVSGKKTSAAWRAAAIVPIRFTVKLRGWKYGPTGTYSSYLEPDLFLYFFNTHKGRWDTFLVDNTTRLYYPAGAADATSLRVRFTTDKCPMVEEKPGFFSADVEWESAL